MNQEEQTDLIISLSRDITRLIFEKAQYKNRVIEIKNLIKGHCIIDKTRLQMIEELINKVLESEGK